MAKYKVGDHVIHPGHQEGPAGTGRIATAEAAEPEDLYRVLFDTGVRDPDGRRLEKTSMSTFRESELKPAD